MKDLKIVLSIALIFLSLFDIKAQSSHKFSTKNEKNNQSFKIIGEIDGLEENEQVLLLKYSHPFVDTSWKIIDSAIVKAGQFSFETRLDDGPRLFMLSFPKHTKYAIGLFGNETIKVTSKMKLDEMPKQTIFEFLKFEGSSVADDFLYTMAIDRMWYSSMAYLKSAIARYRDSSMSRENIEHVSTLIQAKKLLNNSVQYLFTYDFFPKRSGAVCELFTECYDADRKYDSLWLHVFNNLSEEEKNSYYGKILGRNLQLLLGQTAPNFNFITNNNISSSLKKITDGNKLTILHFWSNASNNHQKYHDELSNIYQKYHSKGLEVISVSLDANQNKWKKVIQEDKIPGLQTCDFKEEESEPALLYNIKPRDIVNILLDRNGKIIAWDVDGSELFVYTKKLLGD
jgi:hypothetical protein